ncbi:hypothetical protein U1Q18_011308, partial [Sarracenia purpurea var. burkii]
MIALFDKAALIWENPKEKWEVMVDSMIHRTESSSAASQWKRHERGCGFEYELKKKANKLNNGGRESEAESSKTLSSEKMASDDAKILSGPELVING